MKIGILRNRMLSGVAVASALALYAQPVSAYVQEQIYTFDIPAQDLGAALRDFARTSRQQVVFDDAVVRGHNSVALKGAFTARSALAALLEGSGLAASRGKSGLFIVRQLSRASTGPSEEKKNRPITPSGEGDMDEASVVLVEEIIVTAQKRDERAQDIPISIVALSASRIEDSNVRGLSDLPRIAPNLAISRATAVASTRVSIRGIGASGNTAIEPSVATYVDGIYIPRPGATVATLFDIAGIEVLRGPQGTLFGRNASVGAINIRTATPTDEWEGSFKIEAGTGERYRAQGHINIPLGETSGLRIAAVGEQFDGVWRNLVDPTNQPGKIERFGGIDTLALRGTFETELSPDLTWTLRGDYSDLSGQGMTLYHFDYSSIGPVQLANLQSRLPMIPYQTTSNRTTSQYLDGSLSDKHWGVSSELAYDFGSGFTVKWLGSYRLWDSGQIDGDLSFSPNPIIKRDTQFKSKSTNHELQLISPLDLFADRFSFVAGLYFYRERYSLDEQFIKLSQFCPLIINVAAPALGPGCASGPDTLTDVQFDQLTKSYAAYTQGTLRVSDSVKLTLGTRYSYEDKSGNIVQAVPNVGGVLLRAPESTSLDHDGGKLTWRASLSWEPAQDIMIFGNYSTGFKSGGFNASGSATALGAARRTYNAETVKNYEIGIKSQWLDRRLTANATFYRMDIGGYQDRSFDGVSFVIMNAGGLRHQGVEIDSQFTIDRNFSLNFGAAYLDSEFTAFPFASGLPGFGGTQDLKGERAPFTPEWQGTVGAQYTRDLPWHDLQVMVRTDLSFTSRYNAGVATDNNPQTMQSGYQTLSARLALGPSDESWKIALFGNNLTKKRYCVQKGAMLLDGFFGLRNASTGGTGIQCVPGQPRTVGASLSTRF